jgi:hypothetical protein
VSFCPTLVANDSIRRQETACNGHPHCLAVSCERPVSKKVNGGLRSRVDSQSLGPLFQDFPAFVSSRERRFKFFEIRLRLRNGSPLLLVKNWIGHRRVQLAQL